MNDDSPVQTLHDVPRISYAQNMEDILLDRVFAGRVGTFLDIGANHPYVDNNTYFFYLRGWRGVNVEPSPECQALYREHRPLDCNLGMAVSDADGDLPFFEVRGPDGLTGLSTLSAEVSETHRAAGYDVIERTVPVRTVAQLVEEHRIAPPDILSVDVESHEAAVLRGVPWSTWRPVVLVIESTAPLSELASHRAWEPTLLDNGYVFATFNGVNRFYLREDHRDRLECFHTPVNILDRFLRHDLVALSNKADEMADRYEREKAARAFDHAQHEDLRQAWDWGRVQAQYLQALWEQDRDSFAKERTTWADALAYFEKTQVHFQKQQAAWSAELATWEAERAHFHHERAAWDAERSQRQLELAAAQGELRPYRLIDRLGVVRAGYGLARRVKRKLVS
jgi:FkbM family methyltransferase